MKAFTVEYVEPGFLLNESAKEKYQPVRQKGMIPVVRLPEVDAVIEQAVWAMEELQQYMEHDHEASPSDRQRITEMFASQVVTEWRERQEKEHTQ